MTFRPSDWQRLWGGAAIAGLAMLAIYPLWWPGWPISHEFVYFATRVAVWSSHFAQGDFFPVWSSADNLGLGSPQPAFYHRLFYVLPALAHWLGSDMKTALALGVFACMVLGGLGMRTLLRSLGLGEVYAVTAAGTFVFAHYTAANWLVRGAMAEFSGAMLVPWVFACFVRLLRSPGHAWSAASGLGLSMAGVFYAHSTLAYFLTLTLATTGAVALLTGAARLERQRLLALAAAMLLAAALVFPGLWAMLQFRPDYDLGRIVPPFYQPVNQVRPLADYFWDSFHYAASVQAFRVQLDLAPLALLAVGAALCRKAELSPWWWPLLLPLAVILLLQTTLGATVIESLPGGVYLQFPWRLLAMATPLLIVAAWLALAATPLAQQAIGRSGMTFGSGVAALVMLLTCAASGALAEWRGAAYPRYSLQQLDAWQHEPVRFSFFGEYLPRVMSPEASPLPGRIAALAAAEGCQLVMLPTGRRFEPLVRSYLARCASPATIVLPEIASDFHRVRIAERAPTPCLRREDHPGFCAVAVPAGDSTLSVAMPTLQGLLR